MVIWQRSSPSAGWPANPIANRRNRGNSSRISCSKEVLGTFAFHGLNGRGGPFHPCLMQNRAEAPYVRTDYSHFPWPGHARGAALGPVGFAASDLAAG